MLRIERTANGTNVLYRLSGRIEGNDLTELKTLIKSEPEGKRIVLDLKDLILAGRNAVKYLDHVEMANAEGEVLGLVLLAPHQPAADGADLAARDRVDRSDHAVERLRLYDVLDDLRDQLLGMGGDGL